MNVTTLKPNQPGLCSLQGIKDSTVPKPGEGLAARQGQEKHRERRKGGSIKVWPDMSACSNPATQYRAVADAAPGPLL